MKESRIDWEREQERLSSSATHDPVHDALRRVSEIVETEQQLRDRLGQILLSHGFDRAQVDEWLEDHDGSELLLRPVTKREVEVKAMYSMRPLR